MAKPLAIEEQVAALHKLRADPQSDATRDALSKALSARSNLLVAKAAQLAGELRLTDLLPNLHKAFGRFFADGSDKGCVAKSAIAEACESLQSDDEALFLRGVRHVQMEGAWGGSIDVAVSLRATCARALSRLNTRNALPALTDLLGDAEAPARAAAAQAIGHVGRAEGALPLRLKIRTGDAEPAVMAESFAALLKILGDDAIALIEPFLSSATPELREAAATALGESRLAAAYHLLRARFDREITVDARHPLLLGMALSRHPESLQFLLQIIDDEPSPTAAHAVEALAIYRNDPAVTAQVAALVKSRNDDAVSAAFTKRFSQR
ncbi:MAG TPA: hypothetical protein VGR35_01415 [Tepidisphaeraceae bacterium]|nr:hypothetical protein [Tepidisphaeraceae bacterium]